MCNFKWLCCRIQGGFGFARCGRNEMAAGGMKGRADGTNIWEVWCNKDAGRLWGNIWKRPIRAWKSDSTPQPPPLPPSCASLRGSVDAPDCVRLTRRTRRARHFVCTEGRPSVLPSWSRGERSWRVFYFCFFFPASARIKIILGNFWGFEKEITITGPYCLRSSAFAHWKPQREAICFYWHTTSCFLFCFFKLWALSSLWSASKQ